MQDNFNLLLSKPRLRLEKLEMQQSGTSKETLSGTIKYAEENVKYTLRTYLGAEKGEATYLVDEQEVTGSTNVDTPITQITVPTSGHARAERRLLCHHRPYDGEESENDG